MSNYRPFVLRRREIAVSPERLGMLGDAVFAIAITLLALDITVPEGLRDSQLPHALRELLPAIGAYLLSFAVIGVLWLTQHALFRCIATLDRRLLHLYFALLAVVAALPFPTRLISEYGETATATACYSGAIALSLGFLCAMHLRLLAAPALATPDTDPGELRKAVRRDALHVLVFVTAIPLAFWSPGLAKYWWLLVIPVRTLHRTPAPAAPAPAEAGEQPES
ncbi:TMEM175 family protein [Streptomyces shenzhenensis]|uniref:TMEM175 family protein n=1 Tax=Streptomyces TaxID=1883 RepID=UPI001F1E149F|nr:TMEM175 family protein [Streptomyces shenzhenensis]